VTKEIDHDEFMDKFYAALQDAGGVTDEEMDQFGLGKPVKVQEWIDLQEEYDEVQDEKRRKSYYSRGRN
jgi:hypothetical protein